jgi:hypothetical protein
VLIEVTDAVGRFVTMQRNAGLGYTWIDWTNFTADGNMQLLSPPGSTNLPMQFFRAFSH